jgi:phosphatidylserine/phosphatidylglycerophosphate/cardiolipin synthase-like enzyme
MFSLTPSELYDQTTFYKAFLRDLRKAKTRVIIESPFITEKRMKLLFPNLITLRRKGVRIIVNTKPLEEHSLSYQSQAMWAIGIMQDLDIEVLRTVGHHRKLAIIDNDILWEGSLNILSQNDSCEVMRRIKSDAAVREMIRFTNIKKWC